MTGWSGDGAPGTGSLREFAIGAVTQHFTKTLARTAGRDFRLPTEHQLDAMEAFQLSLGRSCGFRSVQDHVPGSERPGWTHTLRQRHRQPERRRELRLLPRKCGRALTQREPQLQHQCRKCSASGTKASALSNRRWFRANRQQGRHVRRPLLQHRVGRRSGRHGALFPQQSS